jgi:murein tripeptide amidase MpaA
VDTFSWTYYHTLEDIYQWLADLAKKYPDTVQLNAIGKSVEGREILALIIKNGDSKNKVIVEGGIHGCEWISTEFVTYLAAQLTSPNETDYRLLNLLKNYEWNLIPILNPDGYDYSQKTVSIVNLSKF